MKKQLITAMWTLLILLPLWGASAADLAVTPAPTWWAVGSAENAYLGQAVTVGDFNGDGALDLAALATLWESPEVGEGAVYVWQGTANGWGELGNPANAAWRYETNQMNAPFTALTSGDLNGDGYAELIVSSSPYTNPPGEYRDDGAVFVFQGAAGGLGNTPVWQAQSAQDYGYLGQSLAVGDLNGDGYGDLAVSSSSYPRAADGGVVFVWQGSASGLGENGIPANADWKYTVSVAEYDNLGARLAWGDLNGDGYADLVIGSARFTQGSPDEGAVFVFQGSASGLGENGHSANADWRAESDQASAYFGIATALGDVNGDGYADLAVAARFYDHGQEDEGAVFVFQGSASGLGENGTPANADWSAESNQGQAYFDTLSLGDGNGDGYADLAVGAWAYTRGETDEGAVFVWQGSGIGLGENGTPTNAAWSAESNQAYAQFGRSLQLADTAGIISGVPGYSGTQSYEGALMVFSLPENIQFDQLVFLPLIVNRPAQR